MGEFRAGGDPPSKSLIGIRSGMLVVVGYAGHFISGAKRTIQRAWTCRCDCGRETIVRDSNIRAGGQQSCGCAKSDLCRRANLTHGQTGSREHRCWREMKTRCSNPKRPEYLNYGGRGIRVCQRWRDSFEAFLADMGPCPDGYSIDRIDNDGNYEPGNCRWTDRRSQNRNRRSVTPLTAHGRTMTLPEWAEATGICLKTLRDRLVRGWDHERVVGEPVRVRSP